MRAVGVIGYHERGKTTLIEMIVKKLREKGMKVGTIKHIGHGRIDLRGKDSYRLSLLADVSVGLTSREAFYRFREEISLDRVLVNLGNLDFLIVEGFKKEKVFPKIIVARNMQELSELRTGLELAAVLPEEEADESLDLKTFRIDSNLDELVQLIEEKSFLLPGYNCGKCGYENCGELAKSIVKGLEKPLKCEFAQQEASVIIDGEPLPLNRFVSEILRKGIIGMLSALRGFRHGRIQVVIEGKRN